ncbi:MAG: hypothetical protein MJ134_06380 [Lachnospiraceae bacterium]|nr:hypothetical protein [Lachnospiraceae bacterium]
MKKNIIKGIYFTFVLILSIVIIGKIMNSGNADITAEMYPATFPVMGVELEGYSVNRMVGHANQQNVSYMRDSLTPIDADRKITLSITPYSSTIEKISYQVRSIDGERLVEGSEIENYEKENDKIYFSIQLKDLIEPDVEYAFVTVLQLSTGQDVYYYTRIVQSEEYYTKEKLEFVDHFSNITFSGDGSSISKYMESNSSGDNTTFYKVNIHSSLKQVMWDGLPIKREMQPQITIRDIGSQTANISMDYLVTERHGKNSTSYIVTEEYRIRYTKERMYLLDYNRTMDQIFTAEKNDFVNDKIVLGIGNPELDMVESEGGKIIAFQKAGALYSYNTVENRMARVFSFYEKNKYDERNMYQNYSIKILNMEDNGNMFFLVYGYMNRGIHEGETGIVVYYYNSVINTIEEVSFIPYVKSAEILQKEMEKLAYINKNNQFYFCIDSNLYEINLDNKSYEVLADGLNGEGAYVSSSNHMVAWQKENKEYDSQIILWRNLNTGKMIEIDCKENERIKPLGFMGDDLVYGLARVEDIQKEETGNVLFPMYTIQIINESKTLLMSYQKENCFVIDTSIRDNQITLQRVSLEENEKFIPILNDQITSKEKEEVGSNTIAVVATETYEKIIQIALKGQTDGKTVKLQMPGEVLYEGAREIVLKKPLLKDTYYVYSNSGIEMCTNNSAKAIKKANDMSGFVVNQDGKYAWKKNLIHTRNQIMKITGGDMEADQSSLAICLDTILKYEGVSRNSQVYLEQGLDAKSILKNGLPQFQVLDLNGCPMDVVLYYLDRDIPVLAILENKEAVLLVGYNEQNVVIFDPKTGLVAKKGKNDSRELFENNGNHFMTYIPK